MAGSDKTGIRRLGGLLGASSAERWRSSSFSLRSGAPIEQAERIIRDFEDSGQGWFWSTDASGNISYISECIAQQIGKSREELAGAPFQSLFVIEREDEDEVERTFAFFLNSHKKFSELVVRSTGFDCEAWWKISGRPQFSKNGEFTGFLGNGFDFTESILRRRSDQQLALYDSLTGLANRHQISKQLETTLTSYAASKRSCAVMMVDLDRFKQVNDTLGHAAGDELLRQVADRLRQIVEGQGEIGRLGGDEFQIILPDIDDRGELGEIAKKAIAMVAQPFSLEAGRCTIGASIGIAIAPYDGIESETLLRSADLALYASKGGGRGQFRFYSADLFEETQRRRQIEADLREALDREEMRIAYQPRVDRDNKVTGLQAQLEWHHPDFDQIPPEIFMPIAHETNLIGPLMDWAMRSACYDGVQCPGGVAVAAKVSSQQLRSQKFPALVAQALAASELAPDRLELEIPEMIFSDAGDEIEDQLNSLKMLGVKLVLEGFGTGFSSLDRLRDGPFDKIKISERFVRDIADKDGGNSAIVTSIVGLAEALKIQTVMEGVESHDELEAARKLGVGLVQGGIFSQPLPFDEVVDAMASGSWTIEPSGPSRYREDRRSVLRKVGLIHDNYRYEVRLRNLSRTGCLIEGLVRVPAETQFVVDFGNGQLAVAVVKRSAGTQQGLEFELPMVDDGAGGLVTRNRISPYALASAGMPLGALPPGSYPLDMKPGGGESFSQPKFAQVEKPGSDE